MSYGELRIFAELYQDIQDFRKSIDNKIRSASIDPEWLGAVSKHFDDAEDLAGTEMRRTFRKTAPKPIRDWLSSDDAKGVGEHLLARLVGAVGDIRVASPLMWIENTEKVKVDGKVPKRFLVPAGDPYLRSLSQLRSYCGHGDPERRRRSNMSQEEAFGLGNPQAKMLVHIIAERAVVTGIRNLCLECGHGSGSHSVSGCDNKNCACDKGVFGESVAISHYGELYLKRRAETVNRVHLEPHAQCGRKGSPAPAGSPWNPGHQHGDALRIVGKEILKDLWLAAQLEEPAAPDESPRSSVTAEPRYASSSGRTKQTSESKASTNAEKSPRSQLRTESRTLAPSGRTTKVPTNSTAPSSSSSSRSRATARTTPILDPLAVGRTQDQTIAQPTSRASASAPATDSGSPTKAGTRQGTKVHATSVPFPSRLPKFIANRLAKGAASPISASRDDSLSGRSLGNAGRAKPAPASEPPSLDETIAVATLTQATSAVEALLSAIRAAPEGLTTRERHELPWSEQQLKKALGQLEADGLVVVEPRRGGRGRPTIVAKAVANIHR